MHVRIEIRLHDEVLDPQSQTVEKELVRLGFSNMVGVRFSRIIEFSLNDLVSVSQARQQTEKMCQNLLVNSVTETYEIFVEED